METLFLKLLNMSIAAGWLILVVVGLRVVLKGAPKGIHCLLWALVGIRLACPFSWESALSLIPSGETVHPDILYSKAPTIHSGITALNRAVNPVISQSLAPAAEVTSVNPMQVIVATATALWLVGMAALLLYGGASYVRLRWRIGDGVLLGENIWQSEKVDAPFLLGLLRPRIYLPFGMAAESMACVIAHERAHIARRDHWIKPVGFLLLAVYWFHPLVWVAYVLLCRDIELACDERVVKQMSTQEKKAYSLALLTCSMSRRSITACPLAFGEVGIKQRIQNVLQYKKPAFWLIAVAVLSCVAVAVCFLTNPKERESMQWARGLQLEDIKEIELVDFMNAEQQRYHLYRPEEYAGIVALVNGSQGRYTSTPVSENGYITYLYITTQDGVRHTFLNCKSNYLIIDGDAYAAGGEWLRTWYGMTGDSPLPDGFFDAEESIRPILDDEPPAGEGEYASRRCVYMSPLSSIAPLDGDSGLRYVLRGDRLDIVDSVTGEVRTQLTGLEWNWQVIGTEEFSSLFFTGIGLPDISAHRQSLMMRLSSQWYLFNMDGELWIGKYGGEKNGMWSIYSLERLESSQGAVWRYARAPSGQGFAFRFNLEHTRAEVQCAGGELAALDHNGSGGEPQGEALTIPVGSTLYWLPTGPGTGLTPALEAEISFTLYQDDGVVCTGSISISGTTSAGEALGPGESPDTYSAALAQGDGLMLVQASDEAGGLIQAAGTHSTVSYLGEGGWLQDLSVAQADLDGDGTDESITVTRQADGLYVLQVVKGDGSELWGEEMSTAHAGWDSLFLCTLEGKNYLLRYQPTMYQGECTYSYTLFTLENGRETPHQTHAIEFDIHGGEPLDVEEMTGFAGEVNALLSSSLLLLSTEGGTLEVGPSSGENRWEEYEGLFAQQG